MLLLLQNVNEGCNDMNLRFEGLETLIQIFEEDSFNEELFVEFINCEQFKGFIEHEKNLHRQTSEESIKSCLKLTLAGSGAKETYGFNYIAKYKSQIKDKISELRNNSKEIQQVLRERISRYAPLDIYEDNFTIHIYGGGWDYGFSEKDGECYINLALLADDIEFLEDIMAHEYYHSRRREAEIQPYDFTKENYLKTFMYHIMEEGVATLVQFEYEKKYDGFAFISKERFDKRLEYFQNLDNCIRECEIKNNFSNEAVFGYFQDSIPNYIVGYYIAQVLFQEEGKGGLELWNRNCNYVDSFKKYINILRCKGLGSGFSMEVEDYILGL